MIEDSDTEMTEDELVCNLVTFDDADIKAVMKAMCDDNISLDGQFGAIPYLAYVVADKVRADIKNNRDEQNIWESASDRSVTVQRDTEIVQEEVKRDTKIVCYLKEDQYEILVQTMIGDLAMKHSESIGFPKELYVERLNVKQGD